MKLWPDIITGYALPPEYGLGAGALQPQVDGATPGNGAAIIPEPPHIPQSGAAIIPGILQPWSKVPQSPQPPVQPTVIGATQPGSPAQSAQSQVTWEEKVN
ncbi:MAG: hypothetical protein JNL58_13880 [Planctomyces sp.]|nr:hypothetical protein [Planctomyces sp.]